MVENRTYWRKTHLILLLFFIGLGKISSAQYMEFEWSDEFRYTNKKTGFFSEFVGSNQSFIYLLQRNISKSKPYDDAKVMLVTLNRNSLTEDTLVHLKGFPENEAQAKTLNSLDYVKSVVTSSGVTVLWRKLINTDSTRSEEIYAQTFQSDFRPGLPLKKVFEFVQEVDVHQSIFDPTMCVVLSNSEVENLVLGTEHFHDGKTEFRFVTLSSSLSTSVVRSVPLPQQPKEFPGKITSNYELGINENIYIRGTVDYTQEELWELPIGHARTFLSLTIAKMVSGENINVKFEAEGRTISDFSYQAVGGKTRVIGFFGDLSKDTTGIDNQGIFYTDIDDVDLAKTELSFVYFERSVINRLLPKKRLKKRAKEGISEEEVLATRFDIEHIETMSDSSMVLFFTQEYNTTASSTRSNLNGENVYSTESSYNKTDVFALRFTQAGTVDWARSMERKITYIGEDHADLRVVFKYDKFIVLYGNEDAELKPPNSRKKFKHLTEELEYATFDPKSGRAKTYSTPVNEPKTDKRDRHYLDPNSAVVINGQFYFHKMRVRQNALWTAANVVCFPTIYYSVLTGNTKVGKGDFTMMRVMEGKRPKRRR